MERNGYDRGQAVSAHGTVVPADMNEGAFRGMQNQKAGFGMFLKVLQTWNNSATTWRIFVQFHIWGFFKNMSRKFMFH
jgi:hypothetical protein